ncbi:MAG: ATP-binding protein [Lachnospiraceae bacterium]|nr:ATP-binding protein [Lachnospiraceae bacterium]
MRILRIEADGIFLFNGKVVIDFNAEQRIYPDNAAMLCKAFGNTYTNNILSFVGVNASGKTTSLKLISFVMSLLNAEAINNIGAKVVLERSQKVTLKIYFYDEKNKDVWLLETVIGVMKEEGAADRYTILHEKLYTRKASSVTSKTNVFVFADNNLFKSRDISQEQFIFLKDDVSIVIALGKTGNVFFRDLTEWTDFNILNSFGDFPMALIQFLDPSIEYIKFNADETELIVKFKREKETISLRGIQNISHYLSSGTIKGLNVFMQAWVVLIKGGYFIIDEIENHFNKEIVATLIRFFMDKNVNKSGATLIYSTHYIELLDELDRNDGIYIIRNNGGVSIQKLYHILKRNDIKKSDVFQSGMLEGTVPSYEAFMRLKKVMSTGEIVEARA